VLAADDDEMICQLTRPPMSSIRHDLRRIGYVAAERLEIKQHPFCNQQS